MQFESSEMFEFFSILREQRYGESVASVHTEERTYYYTMDWRDKLVDSRSFYIQTGHHNPLKFPLESRIQVVDHVNIGQYELGAAIKDRMTVFNEVTSDNRPDDTSVKLHSGLYYHCNDVWHPEIGDIRVQFSFAGLEGDTYTVIGKLDKGVIVPFETSLKTNVLLVFRGEMTLEEAFKAEHYQQRLTTWLIRFVGWVALFFAATCTSTLSYSICKYLFQENNGSTQIFSFVFSN